MAVDKLRLLQVRLETFKKSLGNSKDIKGNHITETLGKDYNQLLDNIAEAIPETKDILPQRVTFNGPFMQMKKADSTYFDLEYFIDTLIAIIGEVRSGE